MITVEIKNDGKEIAHLEFDRMNKDEPDWAVYRIKYAVERGTAVGLHTRVIYGYARKYYNVLALVKDGLELLSEKDLKLERDFDPDETPVPADMVRRLNPALRALSSSVGRLHHYRSTLRRRQSEQYGNNGSGQEVREEDR